MEKYETRKKGEGRLWIAIPEKHEEVYQIPKIRTANGLRQKRPLKFTEGKSEVSNWEWYRMPDDVYSSKTYPVCPMCKQKFVSIGDYKRCFKCRQEKKKRYNDRQ